MPLPWFSPDPRAVLRPAAVHVARSLRQRLRRSGWTTTVDQAFDDVVTACAARPRREGTWINRHMRQAYGRLQRMGWAHSLEVWSGDRLLVEGTLDRCVVWSDAVVHPREELSRCIRARGRVTVFAR